MESSDSKREMLRHTVATLAYRGGKAVRGANDSFASFRASETTRTLAEILAHIGDLLDWALSIAKGAETWHNKQPQPWDREIERFHAALAHLDDYLATDEELASSCERLFQGPIADALTHVGQLAMLRRIAGEPIKGRELFKSKNRSRSGRTAAVTCSARVRLKPFRFLIRALAYQTSLLQFGASRNWYIEKR